MRRILTVRTNFVLRFYFDIFTELGARYAGFRQLQVLPGRTHFLVVITNPLSKIPLFMSLAAGMTHEQRKQQANLAAIYSFAVMFVSLIGGNLILSFFGISFGAMRVAGGFVIAIIGTQMLFGGQGPNNAPAVQRGKEDYSFFPLAMPGIAGPGTIAVVIGYSTKIAEAPELTSMAETFLLTTLAILVTSIIAWVTLRSSEYCASAWVLRVWPFSANSSAFS